MNEFHKLTKIILICIGVNIFLNISLIVLLTMPRIFISDSSMGDINFSSIFYIVLLVMFLALLTYFLFCRSDLWARKIVGPDSENESLPKVFWVPGIYRMVSVFSGILYLYWLVPTIISSVYSYITYKQHQLGDSPMRMPATFSLDRVVAWIILSALCVYLLYGAPHFVRWQVKTTLDECKQPTEEVIPE